MNDSNYIMFGQQRPSDVYRGEGKNYLESVRDTSYNHDQVLSIPILKGGK